MKIITDTHGSRYRVIETYDTNGILGDGGADRGYRAIAQGGSALTKCGEIYLIPDCRIAKIEQEID